MSIKPAWASFLAFTVLSLWSISAEGHELWVETSPSGNAGQEQLVRICWGHGGQSETGEALQRQQDKLHAWFVPPGGRPEALDVTLGPDGFRSRVTPASPGCFAVKAELQVGILDRELHGIPTGTRIIMCGKSLIHVKGGNQGAGAPLGMDLEIVPVGDFGSLHPGDIATAKVLFRAKPIGGRDVVVSLSTLGAEPLPDDPRIEGLEWSVEDNAEPQTGLVRFPLIVPGQHVFLIRYVDETAGTYEGEMKFVSPISHLRKGDAYERTMYVSTFTVTVKPK